MNAHFQEIAERTNKSQSVCKPIAIKSQDDAAMVSGWIVECKIETVNGITVSSMMDSERGRISLYEWCWINRKTVNDYTKAVRQAMNA